MTTYANWLNDVSGSFNDAADWSTDAVPDASTGITLPEFGTPYTVTSSVDKTTMIYGLGVAEGATLAIAKGVFQVINYEANEGTITVAASAELELGAAGQYAGFICSGSVDLNGGTKATKAAELVVAGAGLDFSGGGTIKLSNSAHNEILGGTSSAPAVFELGQGSIVGAGVIGDSYLTFDNSKTGTVTASDATQLEIVGAIGTIAAGEQTDTNDGTIQATGDGGLVINADMYNNGTIAAVGTVVKGKETTPTLTFGAGSLTASPTITDSGIVAAETTGSTIDLDDASVSAAVVSTVAGSTINSLAGTTNSLSSAEIENAGTLAVAAGSTLNFNGSVQNTGEVQLNGGNTAANAADLLIYGDGALLLSGGKLVLSNSANNLIGTAASAATDGVQLTDLDNVIEGAGTIGDANLRFVNSLHGTVDSDDSSGLTLFGNTNANLKNDYNNGLIENTFAGPSTGAATLTIENDWISSGTIEQNSSAGALDLINFSNTGGGGYFTDNVSGGIINLTNANLTYSYLDTVVGSTVNITPGETSTIGDVIFNSGAVNVESSTLTANSDYYNYGTINLEGSGPSPEPPSTLELNGQLQLRGGGDLVMDNSAGNSIVTNGSPQTFDNYDNTISGFGTIGDQFMYFNNEHNGTVKATATSGLTIDTGSNEPYNAGTFESANTGGLTVQGNLDNEGVLSSTAGNLDVTGNVDGFGVAYISGSGSIEFGGVGYQDVTFESGATGSLIIDHSGSYQPNEIWLRRQRAERDDRPAGHAGCERELHVFQQPEREYAHSDGRHAYGEPLPGRQLHELVV
jgi:hypothetical protein